MTMGAVRQETEGGSALGGALAAYLRAAQDARPLYRKVADGLAEAMAQEQFNPATHLPGERHLAEELGIARATLRRALDELAEAGLLHRRQGARTEVTPRLEKALATLTGFSAELRARGVVPGHRWLSRRTLAPGAAEAMALGLGSGEMIVRLERVRLADGRPIAIERAAVPAAVLPSGQMVGMSLYETLAGLGAAPARGIQRIRAGVMTASDAEHLQSRPGDPILIVERRCFLADGRAVEFTETRYHGASYDFLTELRP
ncbi:MAG: GntR family transcriptional regulator [Rubellimicrobium sp.]|nr:GntR family transcriptional regulator [Rubellimicrobium sp.]